MSKLALRAQTVDIAYLPLRQDLLAKNVLMTAQRDLCLGNSLFLLDDDRNDYHNSGFSSHSQAGMTSTVCFPICSRNFQSPFKKLTINLPPRLMGASVFRYAPEDKSYMIGSLSGLYKINLATGSIDYLRKEGRKITRVCGYFSRPNGAEYYLHHEKGLQSIIGRSPELIPMPEEINKKRRASLWEFCNDLHSGRIFIPVLGQNTWWLMPFIGSLFLLCLGLTCSYDWYCQRHVIG